MPGFSNTQVTPAHAASLPQLSVQSENQPAPLIRDRRQASLLKINLAKENPQDGKIMAQEAILITNSAGGHYDRPELVLKISTKYQLNKNIFKEWICLLQCIQTK